MIRGSRPQPVPPAPTELLLVSRMGDNTSPILLTNVPKPIATFNRPFELSELVSNLDGVMYLYTSEAVNVTCVSDVEEGQTKYFLAYDNGEAHIGELSVDGTTLLCSEKGEENYLFDIDYKHQNRKFWPNPFNEVVGITCPSLLSDPSKYLLCKNVPRDTGWEIRLQVNNNQPISVDAGGTIAPASWFVSGAETGINNLVLLIMKLEYDFDSTGSLYVIRENDPVGSSDGIWNLFTDGAPYIPLRITSRFPNGSPILASQIETSPVKICTFNRTPLKNEIYKIVIIFRLNNEVAEAYGTNWGVDGKFDLESDLYIITAKIEGTDMYIGNWSEVVDVYDIDFDNQFRRSLPADFVKMNVQIPQLLNNPSAGQGFGIMHDAGGQPNFGICTAQDNAPYIIEGNTWLSEKGGWTNSLTWANVQSLLQAIIAMEFEGFDVEPPLIDPVDYREALASGWVVTPLIPQSLS